MTQEMKLMSKLNNFVLKLEKEEAYEIKKGKKEVIKDKAGEIQYLRNDIVGLMGLLTKFDSRIHNLKDYKQWIKLRDRLRQAFIDDLESVELSLDEASFLKEYLSNLSEKEGKTATMVEFEIRSLIGVLEQFGQ